MDQATEQYELFALPAGYSSLENKVHVLPPFIVALRALALHVTLSVGVCRLHLVHCLRWTMGRAL
jgi:hypothetical protein